MKNTGVSDKESLIESQLSIITNQIPIITDQMPIITNQIPIITDQTPIITDQRGNQVLEKLSIPEDDILNTVSPFTHSLIIVKIGSKYLVGMNHYRKQWEIFGGCIEHGETPRQCVIRELEEETGIHTEEVSYIGTVKYILQPDYFSSQLRIEYGALYGVTLDLKENELNKIIGKDKEEIDRFCLYELGTDIGEFAIIDKKFLEYWR